MIRIQSINQKPNNKLKKAACLWEQKLRKARWEIIYWKIHSSSNVRFVIFSLALMVDWKNTNYSENNLPIKCEICGDDFDNERDLKNHMITHSYTKPEFSKTDVIFAGQMSQMWK